MCSGYAIQLLNDGASEGYEANIFLDTIIKGDSEVQNTNFILAMPVMILHSVEAFSLPRGSVRTGHDGSVLVRGDS